MDGVIHLYRSDAVWTQEPQDAGKFYVSVEGFTDAGKACDISQSSTGYYDSSTGEYFHCVGTYKIEVFEAKKPDTTLLHKRITVTFDDNGGSSGNQTQTRTWQEEQITQPSNPTRSGYTFDGWFTAASGGSQISFPYTTPSSDVTFYAQWTIQQQQTVSPMIATQALPPFNAMQYRVRNMDNSGSATILANYTNPPSTNRGSISYLGFTSWVNMSCQSGMCGLTIYATAQVSGETKSTVRSKYVD